MVSDIEALADGLSASQKRAVLWCNPDGTPRQHGTGAPSRTSFYCLKSIIKGNPKREMALTCQLVEKGKGETLKGRWWPQDTWRLTPLGLAVRRLLMEQEGR